MYTLPPLVRATCFANIKPLTEKLLSSKIDPNRLVDTVAVGIPATPAMILGGNLLAGDTVEMTLVPTTTKAESLPSPGNFSLPPL